MCCRWDQGHIGYLRVSLVPMVQPGHKSWFYITCSLASHSMGKHAQLHPRTEQTWHPFSEFNSQKESFSRHTDPAPPLQPFPLAAALPRGPPDLCPPASGPHCLSHSRPRSPDFQCLSLSNSRTCSHVRPGKGTAWHQFSLGVTNRHEREGSA